MSNASNLSTLANVLDDGSDGQFLKSTGSGGVAFDTVAAGAVVYATADLLPLSGFAAGDMAYVTATNRFYINNGSGWYSISLVNTNPNITSVQDAGSNTTPFTLATDGTATVITVTAADPEDVPVTYGYSVTTGDASLNGSTVVQGTGSNTNVFTVTPHASQDATFTITFTASDGINQATSANAFSLAFVTIVTDSNHTTLLATATSTGGNSTIEDSSSANSGSGHNITVNGDAHAGTFSPYRSGGYSVHLDDGEEISFPDSSNYNLSNGSFSIEAWVYPTSYDSPWSGVISQFSSSSRGWGLAFSSTQITFLGSTNGGSSTNVNGSVTSSVPLNQWTHLLVTRDSNTIRIFNNGVLVNNFTESGTFNNSTNPLRIGELNSAASENFRGYIKDARVVKGSVPTEYQTSSTTNSTTIFSVPSEPLTAVTDTVLLTCHLPYISDGSTNNATPTLSGDVSTKPLSPYDYNEYSATDHGGSVYFDGNGDYLTAASDASFDFGTGDFTIETWINIPDVTSTWSAIISRAYSATGGWRLYKSTGNSNLRFYYTGNSYINATSTGLANNTWHHIAVVRSSGTITIYVDGASKGSGSDGSTSLNPGTYAVEIGSGVYQSSYPITGYLSDLRIVKGTAVYTGGFTPPSGPLTTTGGTYSITTNVNTSIPSSNTSLHIKGTDASIIDKSQGTNLKLVGDTTGSTTQAKFSNTKSMKFDGTGDYILISKDTANINTLDKDFTIEFWLYDSSPTTWKYIAAKSDNTGNTSGSEISFGMGKFTAQTDGKLYYSNNLGAYLAYTNSALSANTWYHIAMVRNNNVFTMYLDGVAQTATTTNSGSVAVTNEDLVLGGHQYQISTLSRLNGYIQDFRITNGLARYTASFTPPSAPLEG